MDLVHYERGRGGDTVCNNDNMGNTNNNDNIDMVICGLKVLTLPIRYGIMNYTMGGGEKQ